MMEERFAREMAEARRELDPMLRTWFGVLARPEMTEEMATFTKNYYDALVPKGFSKEEALRIVAAHGVPRAPGVR
jgi:hypothetical protein